MAKATLKSSDFVHLHTHTQYSLLDGLTKLPDLVKQVAAQGSSAIAVTDHGTMSGAIDFYAEAKKQNIKPIIGLETYVAARGHKDKEVSHDKVIYHLTLLAMNNTGYKNLMKLSTTANLEGFYYRPRIDHELLKKYNEGIICLSGCASSEIGEALKQDDYQTALKLAEWYKSVFGDRYYLELQDHGHPKHTAMWDEQLKINDYIMKLSKQLDIPCLVTCDAHYLKKDQREAHEILLCVQTGSYLSDENRMSLKEFELYVTDPKDVIERWGAEHPDYILNTKKIADRCSIDISMGDILLPKFPTPNNENSRAYLEDLVYRGLSVRYLNKSPAVAAKLSLSDIKKQLDKTVIERTKYELEVIEQMNFNGYFLIIADFIKWGKSQGIVFGPGRGSAAGSIVSYAMSITELDPFKYDLLFERFLNPDRISMPDIDIDIQDNRRNEVIEYCINKYGEERVANIVTFGRMAARNAVRDVARVLEVPYTESDRLAKMIPPPVQGRHIPLEKSLKNEASLKNEYATNATAKTVFDLAVQLEGTIRSHGVHAAGVVIAPEDIVNYTPLEMAQKGVIATQYSMGPIEQLGLLKIDFLGLSNLTIINNALKIIKAVHKKDIDIDKLPLDDQKTYDLFKRGDTTGVFQFESNGMKRYLKELNPNEFNDLIAMNALYRPGPMQFIEDFIARKNGKKEVVFDHPGFKAALSNTYGVLVYQEQFMQISKDMCGFTGGQADTLRKAIGKKQRDTMAKMKRDFIEGMVKHSKVTQAFAEKFWAQLEAFADYCYNRAHAACYATIAYQTAYLKAHYPSAFMAALMSSDLDDTDRLAIEINECKHMGLEVLLPDINESFVGFSIVPGTNQIRFGMAAIKNVGIGVVEEILEARKAGKFTSIEDFIGRVSPKVLNKKTMESLIKAGALNSFNDRSTFLANLDNILGYANRINKQTESGQTDLFGSSEHPQTNSGLRLMPAKENIDTHQHLLWERELLGLYLSRHPLEDYVNLLEARTTKIADLSPGQDGREVIIGGSVALKREITTKRGQKMAFVTIEDLSGETEIVLFPGVYESGPSVWDQDNILLIKGRISGRDKDGRLSSEAKVIVSEAKRLTLDDAKSYQASSPAAKEVKPASPKLYITLDNNLNQELLFSLKRTIEDHRGPTEVVLEIPGSNQIKLPNGVDSKPLTYTKIEELVGKDKVAIR